MRWISKKGTKQLFYGIKELNLVSKQDFTTTDVRWKKIIKETVGGKLNCIVDIPKDKHIY